VAEAPSFGDFYRSRKRGHASSDARRGVRRGARNLERWAQEVGLGARVTQRARGVIWGEQQRVAIRSRAGSRTGPSAGDEPTGDLDERNAMAVFELMQRLHREHRLTSILATHNTVLAGRADCVLQLEHGMLRPIEK